jgi:hypothetical protein
MNKLLSTVGLAITFATASMLAGCQLYFGSSDSSTPSGSGPTGGGGGGGGGGTGGGTAPGNTCTTDQQCASGCFCADGTCTEAGFCKVDSDCGNGFHCDISRASCIPNPACTANEQCNPGSMCDPSTDGCVATCACAGDAEAIAQGAGWCDETRKTCMPGVDPAGACTGAITCTTPQPTCPENQVALVKDGCFTGACRAISVCEAAPVCTALQHEDDCTTRSADCTSVFVGLDCTGTTCGINNTDCVCKRFQFSGCEDQAPPAGAIRVIVDGN